MHFGAYNKLSKLMHSAKTDTGYVKLPVLNYTISNLSSTRVIIGFLTENNFLLINSFGITC